MRRRRTMRRMRAIFVVGLLLVGCGTPTAGPESLPPPTPTVAAPPAPQPTTASPVPTPTPTATPAPASAGLRWELLARPALLTMRDRGTFRLRRQVTNDGSVAADAMRPVASFTVNGQASMELDMAFGNGVRESRWSALPPGESAFDEREMGISLFPAPGDYDLAMTVDGATSTVRVRVDR